MLFKKKDLQEKSRFLFDQKLCHGSFSLISASHNARNCKKTNKCKVRKKGIRHCCIVIRLKNLKNPEKVGEEKYKGQKEFHCITLNMSSEIMIMCVVFCTCNSKT